MFDTKRIGIIKMTVDAFNDEALRSLVFSHFHPIKATHDFATNTIEYLGVCRFFDETEKGMLFPTYEAQLTAQDDGPTSIRFVKR